MTFKAFAISICLLFMQKLSLGIEPHEQKMYLLNNKFELSDSVNLCDINLTIQNKNKPNPLLNIFKTRQKKNKRITAAILAFPFPFGIVGLHRIYLGTAPYVPVVYITSLGGIFGILPFIDFCVLILDKDETKYIENKKVFMWVN